MFRDEMSSQARPSLDGMAHEVLVKGRRARRVRRAKIASTVFAAVGLVAAGAAVPRRRREHGPRGGDLDHRDRAG